MVFSLHYADDLTPVRDGDRFLNIAKDDGRARGRQNATLLTITRGRQPFLVRIEGTGSVCSHHNNRLFVLRAVPDLSSDPARTDVLPGTSAAVNVMSKPTLPRKGAGGHLSTAAALAAQSRPSLPLLGHSGSGGSGGSGGPPSFLPRGASAPLSGASASSYWGTVASAAALLPSVAAAAAAAATASESASPRPLPSLLLQHQQSSSSSSSGMQAPGPLDGNGGPPLQPFDASAAVEAVDAAIAQLAGVREALCAVARAQEAARAAEAQLLDFAPRLPTWLSPGAATSSSSSSAAAHDGAPCARPGRVMPRDSSQDAEDMVSAFRMMHEKASGSKDVATQGLRTSGVTAQGPVAWVGEGEGAGGATGGDGPSEVLKVQEGFALNR